MKSLGWARRKCVFGGCRGRGLSGLSVAIPERKGDKGRSRKAFLSNLRPVSDNIELQAG